MSYAFFLITVGVMIWLVRKFIWKREKWQAPTGNFPNQWRSILSQKVHFYHNLSAQEKYHFEFKVLEFLQNCRITGIKTTVDDTDKLLVAASAIIPIFAFPDWQYHNLSEVLLYPGAFTDEFETDGEGRSIFGMVGTGYMDGKMIISKNALHKGFRNETDKRNTAIHEFVHLIDKADGQIDGIPHVLLEKQYAIPWIELISKKIDGIFENSSDINPYGATNKQEFFAVTSEYFFERPKLLAQKHPELYKLLEEIFNQKMSSRNLTKQKGKIGRNDPCPCGSGKKFKKCCGKVHYD